MGGEGEEEAQWQLVSWLAGWQAIDRIVEIANGVKGAINENFRLISVVCVWFVCGA